MNALLQPTHLIFILLIILILFGPGKLPKIGKGRLFMAKGVDPTIGHDVRDRFTGTDSSRTDVLYLCLLAIVLGNTLDFLISPVLPSAARIGTGLSSALPVLVDIWICLLIFGFLNLLRITQKKNKSRN
jgi:hypothetical protein